MLQTSPPPPLSQQAYEAIRRQIISMALPPGAVIDESALQRELGLGRTPIREALRRLALEKLVVVVPRRGTFVSEIGLTDLQRLFEARIDLECTAARLAARRGRPHHWTQMAAVLAELPEGGHLEDSERLMAIDEACHHIMYDAADNDFIRDTLTMLFALSLRLWYFSLTKVRSLRGAVLEHRAIMDALAAGDEEGAAELMRRHIRAYQDEIEAVVAGRPLPNGASEDRAPAARSH